MAKNGKRQLDYVELIFGIIGIGGFAVFVVALFVSIEAIVFGIIIAVVLVMALVDYYQNIWKKVE